jgi:WD40 repeat protein
MFSSWQRSWLVVGFLFLASGGLAAEPPGKSQERRDADDNLLPPGALVRLGTTRLRGGGFMPRAALSPDGKLLALADAQNMVHLVEPLTGKEIRAFPTADRDHLAELKFAPDSKILAATGMDGKTYLWDVATGQKLVELRGGRRGRLKPVAFSANGKVLAQATDNYEGPNEVHVWETATGKELGRFKVLAEDRVEGALSADGKILAAWGDSAPRYARRRNQEQEPGIIQRWEMATGKELARIEVEGGVGKAAFSPDGKTLAAATFSKDIVRLLDPATGKQLSQLAGAPPNATFLAFSPDGKVLAAGGYDGAVEGWDMAAGKALGLVSRPECRYSALAFARDGQLLAWGIEGNTVCLWDARTGRLLTPRVGHQSGVTSVTFTPDARLISGSPEGQVCIWEVTTGKELHRFTLPEDRAAQAAQRLRGGGFVLSPNAKYIAARLRLGPLLLWEAATGKYILRLKGANALLAGSMGIAPPVFSPDSRLVVTGASVAVAGQPRIQPMIQIWELASGTIRAELAGSGPVTALAFSPDGRLLASGSSDTTIVIWDLTGRAVAHPASPTKLTAKQLEDLWSELKILDARQAFQAVQTLVAARQDTVPYLARTLVPDPSKTLDDAAIARLISDLDNEQFVVREEASRKLEQLGWSAHGALCQALARKPSPEVTRRLNQLLEKLGDNMGQESPQRKDLGPPQVRRLRERLGDPGEPDVPPPAWGVVRLQRAVEVLETIATPEARDVLKKLAKGHADDPLTREAQEAVRRLAQRGTAP